MPKHTDIDAVDCRFTHARLGLEEPSWQKVIILF
jgi:hypothetical protein